MIISHKTRSTGRALLVAAFVLLTTGCRGPWSKDWKVSEMWDLDVTPWSHDHDKAQTPERIVGTWTDTVLHQPGKQPERGFGGRLIFYGEDNEKPIQVDGQLVVYAFDETNRDPTDNKPTRRYVFPADQMVRRMSKSELGPSYSFWLPWDEVGGAETEISLIARFEPKSGAIVISEQTRHQLPGEISKTGIVNQSQTASKLPDGIPMKPATPTLADLVALERAKAGAAPDQVQLANYEAAATQSQQMLPPQRRMTTTSISLPENFRVQGGSLSTPPPAANVAAPGTVVLPGNVSAMSQAPPPNYAEVVPPIQIPQPVRFQQPGQMQQPALLISAPSALRPTPSTSPAQMMLPAQQGYPAFMSPAQSPLGSGFVAPLGPPQVNPQPAPATVGQMSMPPAAPILQGQPPLTTASGWATVTYPTGTGSAAAPTVAGPPSFGFRSLGPQAPATPASR
jgi:hypothetical protein